MNIAADCKGWEGQSIDGRFPLLQWLGSSEHSAVFLTELRGEEPREAPLRAVLKLIPAGSGDAETRISRWEATTRLSHPHLIRLFHTGRCEIAATPLLYVVMEFAEEDLSQVLPLRPLTTAEAGEMLPPVVDVLSYLHEKGLVHGHVKPSSVMVVGNQLKLSCDSIHKSGELSIGELEPSLYNAPEATTGTILPAADVWSLGITLVAALTQHPPTFEKPGRGDAILPESIPEPFRGIARECLRCDPGGRCTLENIITRLRPTPAPLQADAGPAPAKRHLVRNIMAPIAAGLMALVVFAGMRLNVHPTQTQLAQAVPVPPPATSAPQQAPTPTAEAATGTPNGVVVQGRVDERVLPDVPINVRNRIQGRVKVRVRVSVNSAGEVLAASVDSQGPSRYFANLALEASRGWSFHPPQIDGQSVASEWILKFQFKRSETQVDPFVEHIGGNPRPGIQTSSRVRHHRRGRRPLSA
jgi:TonB family protein